MAITASYARSYSAAGQTFATSTNVTSDNAVTWSVSLAAAKTGQLTTRTDNTTGTLTMASGHGITTGARLDLYWTGGSRYGVTVGTVATNSVPISGGAGDNLPANLTSITAQVPDEEAIVVTGDDVVAFGVGFPQGGTAVFADVSNVTIAAFVVSSTSKSYVFVAADGGTNPLAGGSVAKVFVSQGYSSGANTANGAVQYD